jgi:hypothetical protein
VIIGGVWIGDRIYWTLWYSEWLNFAIHYYAHTHPHTHTHTQTLVSTVMSSLVVARYLLQRRTFPFLWVPNSPRPQLPSSKSNSSQRLNLNSPLTHSLTKQLLFTSLRWLSLTVLLITSRHGPHRKHRPSVAVCRYLVVCFPAVA